MSDELPVGTHLVIGLPGPQVTDEAAAHLQAVRPGGVILFERNYRDPEQLAALTAALADVLDPPPLVMVDHEGGRVVRFRHGVTQFPSAREMSLAGPEALERQGRTEAGELRRLGIHVNLAPCVDVAVEGADPVIGDRAYGTDPDTVSRHAAARIRGLQDGGVAACAKHFPGLGAVSRDPHLLRSAIALDWDVMRAVHVAPFQAAIRAGVACVMSSHVCYPGLADPEESMPDEPATYSSRLIRDLLKKELGFSGLVLTDDLEMGAVRGPDGVGVAAVRAAAAGHDLLLVCGDAEGHREALSALRGAYASGVLVEAECRALARRVAALRDREKLPRALDGSSRDMVGLECKREPIKAHLRRGPGGSRRKAGRRKAGSQS
ncbi:MAG TPA: beta-N-acetylhexosaminidase [bacterium]